MSGKEPTPMFDMLTVEQQKQILSAFKACDLDKNGIVDFNEVKEVLGQGDEQQAKKVFVTLDKNGDGKISWAEFAEEMSRWMIQGGKNPFA